MERIPPILPRVEKLEKSVILLKFLVKHLAVAVVLAALFLATRR
jgi:hypothetical protein